MIWIGSIDQISYLIVKNNVICDEIDTKLQNSWNVKN